MNNISSVTDCVGCSSCVQVCPKQAITFQENEEGFFYPKINKNCIDCGICQAHCPQLKQIKKNELKRCYASWILDEKKLKRSSSGGVFRALAEYFLQNDGVVYGAAYLNDNSVEHIRVDNMNSIDLVCGSKYVESNCYGVYSQVKADLKDGNIVLFSGTPCQCAGLRAYLGKNYNNLLVVDIICHGVPSKKMFEAYLDYIENKYNANIVSYNFRDKEKHGWSLTYKYQYKKKNGKISHKSGIASLETYYQSFLDGTIYKESCYSCKYAQCNRISDITLGDFWGVEKFDIEKNFNGVSAVIINTFIGKQMLDKVKDKLHIQSVEYSDISENNGNLRAPSVRAPVRDNIYRELKEYGYEYIANKYMVHKGLFVDRIKSLIPNKYRARIKKIVKRH